MSPVNNSSPGLSININDELANNVVVHKNVQQALILTTEDKVRILLMDTKDMFTAQRDWWTPFGLLVSFVATLCSAEFKPFLGFDKEFWHAAFVILAFASSVWLFKSLLKVYRYRNHDLNQIISRLKLKEENDEQRAQNSRHDALLD